MSTEQLLSLIKKNPLSRGVTFSGGEPLLQAAALLPLAKILREDGYELALYTGYTFEEVLQLGDDALSLLSLIDVLIDGPFVQEEKSLALRFRGSKNQRILNVAESLAKKKAIGETSERWGF